MEFIILSNDKAVHKGFWGNDPDRFWCEPDSPDAMIFTGKKAELFIMTTGDSSWNWKIVSK